MSGKIVRSCVKMMTTPGMGIIVAGVASGICYLLISKMRKVKAEEERRSKKPSSADDNRCACCLKPFGAECGIKCGDCGAKICTGTCNRYDRSDDTHNCLFCYQRRCQLNRNDRWLETFGALPCDIDLQFDVNFNLEKYTTGTEHEAINRSPDLAAGGKEERNPMETIRDVIEKIVEEIVGSVQDTRIDRLYDHFAYNSSSSTDAPSMAATALREFVERAVEEARKLPALGNSAANEKQDLNVSDRSYEDLLATAILNKVIDKFQKESIHGNGRVVAALRNKHHDDPSEGLDEVDNGSSSLEPLSQDESNSECGTYPSKCMQDYPEPLSLMIEERIEEVTTYTSDEEVQHNEDNGLAFRNTRRVPFPELGMDIVDPSQESSEDENENEESSSHHMNVISQVESWEENWLFQKKKMQARSEPVAMLVPNPSEEFRALIGDKDAEDTSDLSECCAQSDEEIEQELQEAIENVVPKHEDLDNDEQMGIKLNGVALPKDEKSEKVNGYRASTNPFAVAENGETHGKGNPFKSAGLRIDVSPDVQPLQDAAPKTPMPTPVNDDVHKFLGCDADVLCKKLDNFKNPFVTAKLDESEPEKSATVNRKTNLQSEDEAQRERECTEHYDIAIQRHMDSLRRPKVASSKQEKMETQNSATNVAIEPVEKECGRQTAEAELSHRLSPTEKINTDVELSSPPRPGTIAEREHKKWENAAPIQNNPYSEENIQKRLLEKQYTRRPAELAGNNNEMPKPSDSGLTFSRNKVDIRRFSRDYYINDAKEPTGDSTGRPGNSQRSNLSDTEQKQNDLTSHEGPALDHRSSLSSDQEEELKGIQNRAAFLQEKLNQTFNRSFSPKEEKKIQRLDLKAYGFEGSKVNGDSRASRQRAVNKLDLSMFGFDGGLKKAQSSFHLNATPVVEDRMARSESTKVLSRINKDSEIYRRITMFDKYQDQSDRMKSNFNLYYSGMKSAKSVPNISKIDQFGRFAKYDRGDVSKFILAEKNRRNWRSSCDTLDSKIYSSSDDVSMEEQFTRTDKTSSDDGSLISFPDADFSMPSVKRLAETFNKTPVEKHEFESKAAKARINREGARTPEIQIIESPKQIHSLTARSLSKEFREGLRQIPSKVSHPVRQIKHEEQIAENEVFTKQDEREANVISPGRLRDNIQFWEQLQRQS